MGMGNSDIVFCPFRPESKKRNVSNFNTLDSKAQR